MVLRGRQLHISTEEPGLASPLFLAAAGDPPEVGAGVDAEAAERIDDDDAVLLVGGSSQIPLFERKRLPRRREPAAVGTSTKADVFEQLLRPTGVVRISNGNLSEH